jgi:3-phenylpropionate/trans-cinnamate dioxygenase ferredoxin subunit
LGQKDHRTAIMSKLIPLASIEQVKLGKTKSFKVGNEFVLVVNIEDEYYAIEDRCSHEDSRLSLGCLKGELIDCTLHGSRFNVKTGCPIEEPATEAVKTYPITIINKTLHIQMD